jgi:hypothetical protein
VGVPHPGNCASNPARPPIMHRLTHRASVRSFIAAIGANSMASACVAATAATWVSVARDTRLPFMVSCIVGLALLAAGHAVAALGG